MEDRQSGTQSPANKLRRRTSSDATWKNRRRVVPQDVTTDDVGRSSSIYRLNDIVNRNKMFAGMDRDNANTPGSWHSMTLCPGSSGLPSDWLIRESKLTPSCDNEAVIEQMIRGTIDAHFNTNNYSTEVLRRGFMLYEALNQTRPGCDLGEILKSMGPPDPKKMLSLFLDNMAPTIKRVVAFANLLPGFGDLDREDRAMLFKQGSFEVIVIRYTRLFTTDGMFTPDMTVKIPRHMLHMMPLGDLFLKQYELADAFNSLHLTDAETGLVSAVMLVNADRNGLRNRNAVQKLQGLYLQCLYNYFRKHHPDNYDDLFSRVIELLPLSAAVNESHARKMAHIKSQPVETIAFPDLHNDVFQ